VKQVPHNIIIPLVFGIYNYYSFFDRLENYSFATLKKKLKSHTHECFYIRKFRYFSILLIYLNHSLLKTNLKKPISQKCQNSFVCHFLHVIDKLIHWINGNAI
jgi:hypothetical protein